MKEQLRNRITAMRASLVQIESEMKTLDPPPNEPGSKFSNNPARAAVNSAAWHLYAAQLALEKAP